MISKCQIHNASNRQYYVRVVASNGRTLANSENYAAKADAKRCADLIAGGGIVEDVT